MKNLNKLRGFTIIELVIVMVVIGVLSAVALPRIFNLGGQARKSVVISVSSSLQTAVELVHSQWVAAGQPATVELGEDIFYTSTTIGFPQNTGESAVAPSATVCKELWDKLLKNPPLASVDADCAINSLCKFEVDYDSTDNKCTFKDKDENIISLALETGAVTSTVETIY